MPNEKLIEAAARAICASTGVHPDECAHGHGSAGLNGSSFTCIVYSWERFKGQARAALEAAEGVKPLEFGAGKLVVGVGTYRDKPAVFIAPASMPGDVGTCAKREGHPRDKLVDGEVVMTFPTEAQSQAVADSLVGVEVRPHWMPIDTAPKDGTTILAAHETAIFTASWENDSDTTDTGQPGWIDGSMNRYDEFYTYEPSHWMPLPSPPALTTEGE